MSDLVTNFMELFQGFPEAFGTGKGGWVHRAPERSDFEEHLNGEGTGLGIGPLRRDGTVRFASIDLDEPDFDAGRLMQSMLPGPTFLERSRSGNVHVHAFFADGCPAWVARGLLGAAADAAGKPGTEIFPKQDRLLPDMLGNYINLPFHGDDRPILFALGGPQTQREFVGAALSRRHDPLDWISRASYLGIREPAERDEHADFGDSPVLHRCAEHMLHEGHTNPIGEGARHAAIFMMAKCLLNWREADEDLAWQLLEGFNENSIVPSLPESTVKRAFNNVLRNEFTSTGCDDPLLGPWVDSSCPIASGKVSR